jgi:hypothetical protein
MISKFIKKNKCAGITRKTLKKKIYEGEQPSK